jgi:hypothetical protein
MRILNILACLAVATVSLIAFLLWAMFSDQPSFTSGLSTYGDLPEAATDIAVYKNTNLSGLRLMEFTIPERDFRSYAESQGWKMDALSGPQLIISATEFYNKRIDYYREVSDGLFFEDRRPNGGGVTVVFDRQKQLAYVNRSSR